MAVTSAVERLGVSHKSPRFGSNIMRRIPWFVFACFILAFLGGGSTVALCAIALFIYIPLATLRWWSSEKNRGRLATRAASAALHGWTGR